MAQKPNFTEFFAQNDMSKLMENFQSVPFDMKSLMETQRKNAQAFSEAQQLALEGLQTVAQRQSEILSKIMEDQSALARDLLTEGTPEEKMSKNADAFKSLYERTVKNLKELSEIINRSNEEASNIINKRVSASMNEIKSALDANKASKKKAA